MGIKIGGLIGGREIELEDLRGRKIAIDAFNILYQFLTIIRDRETGEPLKDSKGRITSHLSGLLYRTAKFIELGIKPVYVFDGKPPEFKYVVGQRIAAREEAKKRLEEAIIKGDKEEIRIASQLSTRLTQEMVEQAKTLLKHMGVPFVQAPSEGEAQCSFMCKKGLVYATVSEDYDSLLFDSPRLIRNLSITGKRKLPKKNVYVEIKPELIELKELLKSLKINREQLIILGILIGTDFNPGGIRGIGPKKALELVKKHKTLEKLKGEIEWKFEATLEEIFEFFLHPPHIENFDLKWENPDSEGLLRLMVDGFDFSLDRVKKVIEMLESVKHSSLEDWLKK